MPFIPMPMPKPVCITCLNNTWVQDGVCRTFLGRGMGMNTTAHPCLKACAAHARTKCTQCRKLRVECRLKSRSFKNQPDPGSKVTWSSPQVTGSGPEVTGSGPEVAGSSPEVAGSSPEVTGSSPKLVGRHASNLYICTDISCFFMFQVWH